MLRAALFAMLVLMGCQPDWEEVKAAGAAVVQANRPAIDKRCDALPKIYALAAAYPRDAEMPLEPGLKLTFGRGMNTLGVSLERLASDEPFFEAETALFKKSHRLESLLKMRATTIADLLDPKSIEESKKRVRLEVESLTSIRYVAVLRTTTFDRPTVATLNAKAFGRTADGEGSAGTYTPGRFIGDLQIFDIESMKRVGAIPVEATHVDKVEIRGNSEFLDDTLRTAVNKAITKKLGDAVQGQATLY